jgi:hypothetical protein
MTKVVKLDKITRPTWVNKVEQPDLDIINTALYEYWKANPDAAKFYVAALADNAAQAARERGWI